MYKKTQIKLINLNAYQYDSNAECMVLKEK